MSVPSVPGWLQDTSAVQNSNFASLNTSAAAGMHSFDPSTAGVLPTSSALDHHQFQQQAHQLQNGNSRNSSPGFQASAYNVNSVVPLKRPRPRDESIGSLSPRQTPVGLSTSRSQTPLAQNNQLAYQIYQNSQNPQPQRQYNAVGYTHPHLQHVGSANASPSPIMQSQTFTPQPSQGVAPPPKRVATQSPSPYSPAPTQQSFMSQGSPQVNHISRVSTPQNNTMTAPPQQPFSQTPQGFTSGFSPPAPSAPVANNAMPAQNMQNPMQAHMMFALQRQQQQQHQRMMQQAQMMSSQPGQPGQIPMTVSMNPQHMPLNSVNSPQMPRPQVQGQGQTQQGPPTQRSNDQNGFLKNLIEFMNKQGTPIENPNPYVGGKIVSMANLYAIVMRVGAGGGSQKVMMENKWHEVARSLGIMPEQYPTAAEELMNIFKHNLGTFEIALMRNQRDRDMKQRAAIARQGQAPQTPDARQQQLQQKPTQNTQGTPQQQMQQMQQMQTRQQTPVKQPPQMQNQQVRTNMSNGYTPQPGQPARPQAPYSQPPSTPNRVPMDSAPSPGHVPPVNYSMPPATLSQKGGIVPPESQFAQNAQLPAAPAKEPPTDFKPKIRGLDTHGGLNVGVLNQIGAELMYHKPIIPTSQELGVIDIHALIMMLKSGIPGEVRLALDTLATVSVEPRYSLALESCEDLVETLVDVAEYQVEMLGDHAEEGSEVIVVPAYEDILRACKAEAESLLDVPRFGTLDHDLERAADKLICITTVFRNLSFFESNHKALADPNVVRFLSGVIERIGTSKLLLRTHANTLDFMKDIIVYLSNLSHSITLPSEDEALNLLHLILAFAPQPLPASSGRDTLMFTPYSPSIHRYLPPAVDTLAKLLARDEPNRAFYRTIFLSESTTSPAFDLLTRSFALAISPIPDNNKIVLPQIVEARKPFLEQGMLAAELLAGIAPGPEYGIARSWLSSEDGFALSLLRLVCLLSPQTQQMHPRQPGKMQNPDDTQPFARITHRGMAVLRKLAEKSEDPSDEVSKLPLGVLPKKESLLGALLTVQIDPTIVRQLCSYGAE
ncbi:hypothetical protein RUND412_008582 [Rhizina undulata]